MLVSSSNAGQLLGVSDKTIREYADSGLIPYTLVGKRGIYRFSVEDLRKYAEDNNRYFDYNLSSSLTTQQNK